MREVPLRPGVEAFLRQLDDAGVPRALVSSDRTEWLVTNLERLGRPDGWAAMVCADGDAARAKPNPHLYEAALELLGVPAVATFAIEDSPNGIRAAKAAGIPCLCVPNEATAELDLSEADLVVPTFEGLSVDDVWNALRRKEVGEVAQDRFHRDPDGAEPRRWSTSRRRALKLRPMHGGDDMRAYRTTGRQHRRGLRRFADTAHAHGPDRRRVSWSRI